MPCGIVRTPLATPAGIDAYVNSFTLMSVEYGRGRMPPPVVGWKFTYVPTPRAVGRRVAGHRRERDREEVAPALAHLLRVAEARRPWPGRR